MERKLGSPDGDGNSRNRRVWTAERLRRLSLATLAGALLCWILELLLRCVSN